ncbi:MAG: ATP-dependent DNA helicase RecG [Negativibacillus sp.]
MLSLDTNIQFLKGVGEKRAQLYKKLQIETIGQLLYYFPRSYLDLTQTKDIADCHTGEIAAVRAFVTAKSREQHIRKGLSVFKLKISDDSGPMNVTFFNAKYTVDSLQIGEEYLFYGKITSGGLTAPMIFPTDGPTKVIPIYPLTQGLSSKTISSAVQQSLSLIDEQLPDPIPQSLRQQYSLCHLHYALCNIHLPSDPDAVEIAKRRLIFEEFFTLALSLASVKSRHSSGTSYSCPDTDLSAFYSSLPFAPTGAQKRAIEELCRDLGASVPMNRLIQGDVGSGKTLVAAAGICIVCQNGFQAAMMAPTEILAHQHFESLSRLLKPLGLRLQLLTGSMSQKEKILAKQRILAGKVDVCIGTHALISDDVSFSKLALVITDEQHRFGVAQRAKLSGKSENCHTLVMSATPIPRTLALMVYGDLDVSVLDELPPGRQKIDTFVISSQKRAAAYGFIREHLDRGLQAYIVCPLVESGETDLGLLNASDYAADLAAKAFAGYKVGLLHGKMKAKEKDQVMEQFKNGEIQLLVSTTVIEVGVDVPNAVIMMIENAERFGLSQLHQLRGRVGRGKEKSTCILVSDNRQEDTRERLNMLHKTNNGFEIAEYDLKTRGPGDFLGMRQHGLPQLKIADLSSDMQLLMQAQEAAQAVLAHNVPMTEDEHQHLTQAVRAMLRGVGSRPN